MVEWPKVRMIAHRGFSAKAPENTIIAFEKAVAAGYWGVECDISLSRDNIWVLMHDNTIDRTTDGRGKVRDFTLDDLKKFDAGGWKDTSYIGTEIPTLEEFIDTCNQGKVVPYIEIKDFNSNDNLKEIIELLESYDLKQKASIISFNYLLLEKIRIMDKSLRLGFLCKLNKKNIIRTVALGNSFLNVNYESVKETLVNKAKNKGIEVECWTVNEEEVVQDLINMGITGITTDSLIPGEYI